LKILVLISGGDVGGAKTHVLSLYAALGKSVPVTMVCFMEAEFTREAREMGIDTRVIPGSNIPKTLGILRGYIRSEGFDLIHSHGSRGNFMAWLLKKEGLPLLTTVHSDPKLDYMGRPAAALTYGLLNRMALRQMDWFTGVSDSMADTLISRGFPPDRIFTIYNGVDMSAPRTALPRAEFLASHGVSTRPGDILVGIAARLNPVKDVGTLIRGFAGAQKQVPALRLLIAGDGQQEAELKALAASLGVERRVHFLGWLEDTDSFYAALDINTLTSLSETFPYALTEGARWHKATVSSRVGGVPRLIDHGVSGMLFPAGDSEKLSQCLITLGQDEALRQQLAEALQEKTRRLFSLDATVNTQKEIYETVLRRSSRPRNRRDRVIVCGAYGRGNAGDESILRSILTELRAQDPDLPVWVVSRNPKETELQHRVPAIHTFDILRFALLCRRAKLYLNGGGSLIQDVTSRRSLLFYLFTLRCAHRRKVPVVIYGCGIGPVNRPAGRKLAGRVISRNVDVITLREDSSIQELNALGVSGPRVLLAADPSLTLPVQEPEQTAGLLHSLELLPEANYVCFLLRLWPGFEEKAAAFAEAADLLSREDGLRVLFLSISQAQDDPAALQVLNRMQTPGRLLPAQADGAQLSAILSRMQAVVSMRLHGLIFAAGRGVPLVGVVYDPKVRAFLRYIGQDRDMDLEDVTADRLVSAVRDALRCSSPETQRQEVSRLRQMELVNQQVLAEYLNP